MRKTWSMMIGKPAERRGEDYVWKTHVYAIIAAWFEMIMTSVMSLT